MQGMWCWPVRNECHCCLLELSDRKVSRVDCCDSVQLQDVRSWEIRCQRYRCVQKLWDGRVPRGLGSTSIQLQDVRSWEIRSRRHCCVQKLWDGQVSRAFRSSSIFVQVLSRRNSDSCFKSNYVSLHQLLGWAVSKSKRCCTRCVQDMCCRWVRCECHCCM